MKWSNEVENVHVSDAMHLYQMGSGGSCSQKAQQQQVQLSLYSCVKIAWYYLHPAKRSVDSPERVPPVTGQATMMRASSVVQYLGR